MNDPCFMRAVRAYKAAIMEGEEPEEGPEKDYLIRKIFRDHLEDILKKSWLTQEQRKAALSIASCKTESLGFNATFCSGCGRLRLHYASCNNRNCPCCQYPSQQGWISQRENEVIPDIPYYHVILTVPHMLNDLIRMNPELLLGELFSCASRAVLDLCNDRRYLGAVPGIISVLHTWQQNLLPHYHIHMIVSGGGLDRFGHFVSVTDLRKKRKRRKHSKPDGNDFFLPLPAMMNMFRGKMIDSVKLLWNAGKLIFPQSNWFTDPNGWASFCDTLYTTKWVGKIVKTFNGNGNAIDYLARYTYRTAISNSRILDYDGDKVSFSVTNRETGEKKPCVLPAMEFIFRFLTHVLPKGFTRVRYAGFLTNSRKTRNLNEIHRQRNLSEYVPSPLTRANKTELFRTFFNVDISICKNCGCKLFHLPRGRPLF